MWPEEYYYTVLSFYCATNIKKERLDVIMNLKKEIKKFLLVSMAAVILLCTFSVRAYAVGKKSVAAEGQKGNSKHSGKKKQKKEYAKWKIKKINGEYFYKEKSVRLLVDDTGKKSGTNKFYCNKKGEVSIKIVRNKKGKIKKIKKISKEKTEEMMDNYSMTYCNDIK